MIADALVKLFMALFGSLFLGGETVETVTSTGTDPTAEPSPAELDRIDDDLDSWADLPDFPSGMSEGLA